MIADAHPGFKPPWTNLAFRPYLLNPDLDGKPPVQKLQHLEQKLGKPFAEMGSVAQLRQDGKEYGLRYQFGPKDLATGTLDSHRLLQYIATVEGTEATFAYRRELMRLFNEEGTSLSDHEVLLDAARRVGVDAEVARSILDSDAYRMDVTWMSREAKKAGIDMVPHYRFYTPDGLHSVAGFYNEWHFLDAFYRAFPLQTQWPEWEAASGVARAVVEALNALHTLKGAQRMGQAVEGELEQALEDAEACQSTYR
eukprot:CAMPEP_0180613780 /NCGR_PEP_ID=MMETSP1037_2-20121125/31077_1 /TAXON_ID=632150 /ORGANISM="Azadinium spinosum, Strain 3D9" /LENGTH=252 /DNA_ID=CAMNT_0022633471 /DNA_START=271 /DNA_END=1026 /DNA_ORIENTATION=-